MWCNIKLTVSKFLLHNYEVDVKDEIGCRTRRHQGCFISTTYNQSVLDTRIVSWSQNLVPLALLTKGLIYHIKLSWQINTSALHFICLFGKLSDFTSINSSVAHRRPKRCHAKRPIALSHPHFAVRIDLMIV